MEGDRSAARYRQGGVLDHVASRRLASDLGPVPDCPSFRCGLNRRPVVSRPLARRGAADPTSLREGRPAVCAGRDLLARKPALLAQSDRTCEAARPLPVLSQPHRRADRHGPEPLRQPRKEQTWPSPPLPIAPTPDRRNPAEGPPSKWSASPAPTPSRRTRSPKASARLSSIVMASEAEVVPRRQRLRR